MLFYTTGKLFSAELVVYNGFLHLLRKVLKLNQNKKPYTVQEADWLSIMMFYPELNLIKNILSRKTTLEEIILKFSLTFFEF